MALKYSVSIEEIDTLDESVKALYTETTEGTYVLDVEDVKPLDEFNTVYGALQKEREAHKEATSKLKGYGETTPESVLQYKDKIAELEALSAGSDPEKLEAVLKARIAPYQREADNAKIEADMIKEQMRVMSENMINNTREQDVTKMAASLVKPEFMTDILLRARYELKYNEDLGTFVDENGAQLEEWITIQTTKTPSWILPTTGAGAHGGPAGSLGIANPWVKATFNLTEQGRMLTEQPTLAAKLQKMAGL